MDGIHDIIDTAESVCKKENKGDGLTAWSALAPTGILQYTYFVIYVSIMRSFCNYL